MGRFWPIGGGGGGGGGEGGVGGSLIWAISFGWEWGRVKLG